MAPVNTFHVVQWIGVGIALSITLFVLGVLGWYRGTPLAQSRRPGLMGAQVLAGALWVVAQLVTTGALGVDPGLGAPATNCVVLTLVAYHLGYAPWACLVVVWMGARVPPGPHTRAGLVAAALTPLVAISVWSAVAASGNYRGFVFRGLPDLESDSSSGSGPTGDLSLVAGPAGACVLTTDSRMGLIFAVLISVVAAVFTAALALPAASDYGLPNAMWGCLVTMGGTALACAVVVGLSANNDVGTVAAADTLYILVSAGAVVWFACAQAWTAVVPLLQGATVTEAAIATRALLAACGVPLGPSDHWVSHCMAHVGPRCLEVTTVNGKPKGGPVLVPLPREGRDWGNGSSTRWPTRPPAHASVFEVGSPSDEEDEQLPAARAGAGTGTGTGTGTPAATTRFTLAARAPRASLRAACCPRTWRRRARSGGHSSLCATYRQLWPTTTRAERGLARSAAPQAC
jgi:hypothetical protein